MFRRRRSRTAALIAGVPVLAAFAVMVGAGPAAATNCSGGLSPDFSLTQSIATGTGTAGYDLTVTNYGTCGATDVEVVVTLPAGSSFTDFSSVQRSWSCAVNATNASEVDCFLQSQLDQKSTQSSGASGTAEVLVNATAVTGGNRNNPPDVTDYAYVTDDLQPGLPGISGVVGPYDPDDAVWGGALNPKTGSTLTATSLFDNTGQPLLPGSQAQVNTVNVPAGTGGPASLTEASPAPDWPGPDCLTQPPAPHPPLPPTCNADINIDTPTITSGYKTIVMQIFGTVQPPVPWYDESNDSTGPGPVQMFACQGQAANPPCWAGTKGYNQNSTNPNKPPYFLVTIHDSSGSRIWG